MGSSPTAVPIFFHFLSIRQVGRQTDRQTDRQADRETGRQTDREMERTYLQEKSSPGVVLFYVMGEKVINGGVVLETVEFLQLVKVVREVAAMQSNKGRRRCGL